MRLQRWPLARWVGLFVALSLVNSLSAYADPTRTERQESVTKGTNQGKPGFWVTVTENDYTWTLWTLREKLERLYTRVMGGDWSTYDFSKLIARVEGGQYTLQQVESLLTESKGLVDSHMPDAFAEWHSRELRLWDLRANFGNSGGWIDGWGPYTTRDQIIGSVQGGSGCDGTSIAMQASRLLRLSELMDADILPQGKYEIQGFFSHYAGNGFQPEGTYWHALSDTNAYGYNHGRGSWSDILSLGSSYHNIFDWYTQYWGYGEVIDLAGASSAQLRAAAQAIYYTAAQTGSPIALDLKGKGYIGVTGRSTARDRAIGHDFVEAGSVHFDLLTRGKPQHIEWMNEDNDALLVDDRQGEVSRAAAGDGILSGKVLFGNTAGFDNGYAKLAKILMDSHRLAFASKAGTPLPTSLKGHDLDGLKLWIDRNHDAHVQPDELASLESRGITEIEVLPHRVRNAAGETLMQSTYVTNGKRQLAEDVWFAIGPDADAQR